MENSSSDTSTVVVEELLDEQEEPDTPKSSDNLALIMGLDPYNALRLNQRGIKTYSQVAGLTDSEVAAIEEEFDLPGCFNRYSWQYQAEQLALEE